MKMCLRNLLLTFVFILLFSGLNAGRMVCFYNASRVIEDGPNQISLNELVPALQFCNYLVHGYFVIDPSTYELKSPHSNTPTAREHFLAIKRNNPNLKLLLSVGGDEDHLQQNSDEPNKYLKLLEEPTHRAIFVRSAVSLLQMYGFDGLDLAWQLPKTPAKRGVLGRAWDKVKGLFQCNKEESKEAAEEHKQQFSVSVEELRAALRAHNYGLSMTVLPNVNAELYIDVPAVMPHLDFVNLATFDFHTPIRQPKEADYPAPLYALYDRDPRHNIDYQVNYWLNQTAPASKLHVGIPAFGRAWQLSKKSGLTGHPPLPKANGVAPAGAQTQIPGLLSFAEVCEKMLSSANREWTGADAPLRVVSDPTRRYGCYAYRSADDKGEHGMWVGYEDPLMAVSKADYVVAKHLGGVALFDLTMDDYRGHCAGEKFPLLRSIKYKL